VGLLPPGAEENRGLRKAEFILRPTFDNAFRGPQPRRQPVWSRILPALGDWRETSLLSFAFEAEPAVAEFAGDDDVAADRAFAAVLRLPAISEALESLGSGGGCGAAVDLSSFCCGGRHQPDFPTLAAWIEKGSVTHTSPPSQNAPRSELLVI